jgi:hypothetical protein
VTVTGITPLPLPVRRIDPLDPPLELGWFRERRQLPVDRATNPL